jgi:hypothetical protein
MGRYFTRRGQKVTARDKALAAATVRPREPEPKDNPGEVKAIAREDAPFLWHLSGARR